MTMVAKSGRKPRAANSRVLTNAISGAWDHSPSPRMLGGAGLPGGAKISVDCVLRRLEDIDSMQRPKAGTTQQPRDCKQ